MNIKPLTIAQSLNKAYLKQDVNLSDFNRFIEALRKFYASFNAAESEEYQKNTIAEFLKAAHYQDKYLINTCGRIDKAIFHGSSPNDAVGVMIEAKKISNTGEMMSLANPNAKALHEVISYYLEQSLGKGNKEIKHVIVTNSKEWFIFDGAEFEREFYKNTYLNNKFREHKEELFGASTTDWFYSYLKTEIVPKLHELTCTHFDLFKFKDYLDSPERTEELIELYKLFSPEHLLKKPFANDSNTLDSQFYDELLHIIGLEESKDGGKKVLTRLPEARRHEGALLENTINNLRINNSLANLPNAAEFGADEEEQYFSVGLELVITWLNRILFLKLLEAQLIKYHANDYSYKFLSSERIEEFDDLQELFFEVLALKPESRGKYISERYAKIPYLNSSLFEITELEQKSVKISDLKDKYKFPISAKTVLKSIGGERIAGELKTQKYLLDFLDAYNFASDGTPGLQESNKTIINSSVLGLIFEKLNGYKDGSFFTPGYITMYMCRESISRAVVTKFNEVYAWQCVSLDDLYNKLGSSSEKLIEYNRIFNSIRLVDPAVGSGHFLVSALNEFIRIKSDLGILIDENGRRLRDYKIEIENDELIITDDEGKIFSYLSPEVAAGAKRDEMQRVQKTIFHEKQTIIENCLFGVDINPKSVSICRLRLWIELLKNMYYKPTTDNAAWQLEVLPNIDINIKCGNSLISRFAIDDNAKISRADAKVIPLYKQAVGKYKSATDKADKKQIVEQINNYRRMLKGLAGATSAKHLELSEAKQKLDALINQTDLFAASKSKKEEKEFAKQVETLNKKIATLQAEVDDIEKNPIYANAFEWRFEFPEVLNDEGDFIGFDVVIGNPPYIQLQSIKTMSKEYERLNYKTFSTMGDLYALFYERGFEVLKAEGKLCFISGSAWMRANYGKELRIFFNNNTSMQQLIDLSDCDIFDSATVLTTIVMLNKSEDKSPIRAIRITRKDQYKLEHLREVFNKEHSLVKEFPESSWIISDNIATEIKAKVETQGVKIKDWDIRINRGILTGYNEAFIIDSKKKDELINQDSNSVEIIKPILRGRDVKKYCAEFDDLYLLFIPWHFPLHTDKTITGASLIAENAFKLKYPAIYNHLFQLKNSLLSRNKAETGVRYEWYALQRCANTYFEEFEKKKIIYSELTKFLFFSIDYNKQYIDKTAFIMTGNSLEYLVCFLNSTLFKFCFAENFSEIQGNTRVLSKVIFEQIPIKQISEEEQAPFIDLVDIILAKKEKGEDTKIEENKIDRMVYELYGLTEEEIKIVENSITN